MSASQDVIELAFKDKSKLAFVRANPCMYGCKPRLATARECLNASLELVRDVMAWVGRTAVRLFTRAPCGPPTPGEEPGQGHYPVLVPARCRRSRKCMHGLLPRRGPAALCTLSVASWSAMRQVTDPSVSKALHEQAASEDKTLKLYDGMWHALTGGEPDASVELVFRDMFEWLAARTPAGAAAGSGAGAGEAEQKAHADRVAAASASNVRLAGVDHAV